MLVSGRHFFCLECIWHILELRSNKCLGMAFQVMKSLVIMKDDHQCTSSIHLSLWVTRFSRRQVNSDLGPSSLLFLRVHFKRASAVEPKFTSTLFFPRWLVYFSDIDVLIIFFSSELALDCRNIYLFLLHKSLLFADVPSCSPYHICFCWGFLLKD